MEKEKKSSKFKSVLKFLFSHVGISAIVVLYCLMGGFLFEHLEKTNEIQTCYDKRWEYQTMENKTFTEVKAVLDDTENTSVKMFELEALLTTFRDNSVAIGYTGEDCSAFGQPGGPKHAWTLSGSFFFCATVISTIGYGHIAPKTTWGRLACITYALMGIPLVLICLANIGDSLANVIRFIYYKMCCCGFCRTDKTAYITRSTGSTPDLNKDRAVSTIQHPGLQQAKLDSLTDSSRPATPTKVRILPLDISHFRPSSRVGNVPRGSIDLISRKPKLQKYDYSNGVEEEIDDIDTNQVSVPLTVTIVIVALYILGGTFLFGLWEGWELLQASYFCYITLSTIGFGDITPATDFDSPQAHLQLIVGSIYILFGLSILGMAFSLMQEEITVKFKWIGQKLGIVDPDDDE